MNREKLGIYDSYDYNSVSCPNAERLQKQIIQLKTNYYDEEEVKKQADVLRKTICCFDV